MKLVTLGRLSLGLLILMATGCATCRRPPPAAPLCCAGAEVNRLAIISYDSRKPIHLIPLAAPHVGLPFVDEPNASLRDLTIQQTEFLAARTSPIARQIQSEKSILCRSQSPPPPAVLNMLDLQAAHERNQSAGQAMQAYLNLVEVHLQHELIVQSKAQIDEAIETVARLRENQITIPLDDREFQRQHLQLDERSERARHQQHQLNTQLDSLLNLDKRYDSPIWTNYQSQPLANFDKNAEVAAAIENRNDLAALECLVQADESAGMLEWLRAAARNASPLLGVVVSGKGLLALCHSSDDRESETANRRCQAANLAKSKRDMIEMEVSDAVDSIATRQRVIELKRQAITSLEESLAAAIEGKDIQPVDLQMDLENKLRLLTLRSELIHEIIQLESDVVRLRQAQGVLGQNNSEDNPTAAVHP